MKGIEDYIKKSKERLITAASNSLEKIRTERKRTKTRKQKCGKCMKISSDKLTKLLTRKPGHDFLKRETESLLIAAQNNAIRTDYIKVKIDISNRKATEKQDLSKTVRSILMSFI